MENIAVFVYGTLMNGMVNHDYYLMDAVFVGKGEISGFDLYELGHYPGIVPGTGTVQGEVYLVDESGLKELDYLEAEGELYTREIAEVHLEDGTAVSASVYVYLLSIEGCEKLNGLWKPRRR